MYLQGDNDKLASIYATALVELAQAKNALDTVHADVDSLQVWCTPAGAFMEGVAAIETSSLLLT